MAEEDNTMLKQTGKSKSNLPLDKGWAWIILLGNIRFCWKV
jgi:hypothetical protein